MNPTEESILCPTVIIGLGGIGIEILARVRSKLELTYGGLEQFPIVSFLAIDTDRTDRGHTDLISAIDATPSANDRPEFPSDVQALTAVERLWITVNRADVLDILAHPGRYPWLTSWLPEQLGQHNHPNSFLAHGTDGVRALGRLAFFYHYPLIQQGFQAACDRTRGHEKKMLKSHDLQVERNALNVVIIASLGGGTGSGMATDLGYCIRHWNTAYETVRVRGILPFPSSATVESRTDNPETADQGVDNLEGIHIEAMGDRHIVNSYAALMELNYFSDPRTEYITQLSSEPDNRLHSTLPPFDQTYLVETPSRHVGTALPATWDLIAQHIALDLTPVVAGHQHAMRQALKAESILCDPGGRSYPRDFMSFGLASIEIPITPLLDYLSNQFAADLMGWWLKERNPNSNQDEDGGDNGVAGVAVDRLKRLRLSEAEILTDIISVYGQSLIASVGSQINQIRDGITTENWLQCTLQGVNCIGSERGKILHLVDGYLVPQLTAYQVRYLSQAAAANSVAANSIDSLSPGEFLQIMRGNRDRCIQQAKQALDTELYALVNDDQQGLAGAIAWFSMIQQYWQASIQALRQAAETIYQHNETQRQRQYDEAIAAIQALQTAFAWNKQDQMTVYCEKAVSGVEGQAIAFIQRQARLVSVEVLMALQEHVTQRVSHLTQLQQRVRQLRDRYQQASRRAMENAEGMRINGIKLYIPADPILFYARLVQVFAASGTSEKPSTPDLGSTYRSLSQAIWQAVNVQFSDIHRTSNHASPFQPNLGPNDESQLLNLVDLPSELDTILSQLIYEKTLDWIKPALQDSRLQADLTVGDRLYKTMQYDSATIQQEIRRVYQQSQPLIQMSRTMLMSADVGFMPSTIARIAIASSGRGSEAASLLTWLKEQVDDADALVSLAPFERYRILFMQEMSGFSLRCLQGLKQLQQAYHTWQNQAMAVKRQSSSQPVTAPLAVHSYKTPPFWDLYPEVPALWELLVQARALGVLQLRETPHQEASAIVYYRSESVNSSVDGALDRATDGQAVAIASTWAEAVQVLDYPSYQRDREEIQYQTEAQLIVAKRTQGQGKIYDQLMAYLSQREQELASEGGSNSVNYQREARVIHYVIETYRLSRDAEAQRGQLPVLEDPEPQLVVVIDEARRQQELAEIVGTEFFQNLVGKVKRSRRNSP